MLWNYFVIDVKVIVFYFFKLFLELLGLGFIFSIANAVVETTSQVLDIIPSSKIKVGRNNPGKNLSTNQEITRVGVVWSEG